MKSKIAVLFLIVLLCLTSGCSNTSHIAEQPASVSSSGSIEALSQAETAQATEKTEVEQPRSTEPEYSAPPQKEQPSSLIAEKQKPAERPRPAEQQEQEPTEPAFDIDYWINLAQSYAESVGLTLDSEAVYCWDNPIAAGTDCKYTERDIKGYINRYAKDPDITDVWIWYEQTGTGSFEVYIGYAFRFPPSPVNRVRMWASHSSKATAPFAWRGQ